MSDARSPWTGRITRTQNGLPAVQPHRRYRSRRRSTTRQKEPRLRFINDHHYVSFDLTSSSPPALAARGGLWVRADNLEIHLGVEEDFLQQKKAHPGIFVGDIDALSRRIESHGHMVDWDNNFPGMRRFYVWENHGNRLEFLSPEARI
ncbi:hypothetical protein [Paeniglutamicibacter antarcticus]|uniref:hypothetical protein n=1 Tax=Paeniglutamicibacter antarcticus TaxID=494023 RepID=UPI0031ED0E7E